jgi:hypothetical protein
MTVINVKTGEKRVISAERWKAISDNGFAHLYQVVDLPKVPQEVAEHIEKEQATKSKK